MAHGIKHRFKDGMYYLEGTLDEHADFSPLHDSKEPVLRLNMRGVDWINSLGLRRIALFVQGWGERPLEFHELPPSVIEAVNVMPALVGGVKRLGRIRSVTLPMVCDERHTTSATIAIQDLLDKSRVIRLPALACKTCRQSLRLDIEGALDDFLYFLTMDSGVP